MAKVLTVTVLMCPTHPDVLHILSECHHYAISVSHGIASLILLPSQHPVKTYGYAFFFSLTGYFGISFVLALIKLFGALVAVTGKFGRLLHNDTMNSSEHTFEIKTQKMQSLPALRSSKQQRVLCVNFRLLFVVLVYSDYRQKGNDHHTFLHVLRQTFHFSVSAITF